MIVKYLSKFVLEILPSVAATIIGAYIVNHYIVARPADAPVAAAVSTVDPKATDTKATDTKAAEVKASETKGSETPSDVASAPEPATKKSPPDKAAVEKTAERSADKPTETASLPVETRRHQPAPRDKTNAKAAPAVQTPAPAVATASIAPAEASPSQEDRRDANDLARAVIERLRGPSEASRPSETPRVQDSSRVAAPVQPLPPPIMVSTPPTEAFNPNATASLKPSAARNDDPRRPTPPADIPSASRPMDLHAEAAMPEHTSVADDVLSAAKSVFHAVVPR
jgi:hypothetical protein